MSGSLCWPPQVGASGAKRPLAGRSAVPGSACATPLLHPGHPPPGPKPMRMRTPWTPPEPPDALSGGLAAPIHALADMACTLLCLLTILSSSRDATQLASVVDNLPGSQVDGSIPRIISETVYLLEGYCTAAVFCQPRALKHEGFHMEGDQIQRVICNRSPSDKSSFTSIPQNECI